MFLREAGYCLKPVIVGMKRQGLEHRWEPWLDLPQNTTVSITAFAPSMQMSAQRNGKTMSL
jgi:hypothetical protein